MKSDPRVQEQLEQRAAATKQLRQQVLRDYAEGNWLQVAPVQQTAARLRRKGKDDIARDLERQEPRISRGEEVAAELESAAPPAPTAGPAVLGEARGLDELGDLIYEQIIGESEIIPARFVHKGSRAARGVGRIVTRTLRQPVGSGVLVSPRLLMTNHHVLESAADARGHIVQLGYLSREDGTHSVPIEFRLEPDILFLTSPVDQLDFSLVAVEPVNLAGNELSTHGWSQLIGEVGKGQQGERVNIVHHPQGLPMQVSIRENFLALVLDDHLHYMTDTMHGSSGSPVYNDEWELVALHHAGREISDPEEIEQYRQALRRDSPAGVDPTDTGPVLLNEGARVSRIVATLRQDTGGLGAAGRALLDQALSDIASGPDQSGPETLPHRIPPMVGPEAAVRGGAAVWTIPLTVSVGLGGFSPSLTTAVSPPADTRSAGELQRDLELYVDEVNSQKSVLRGLSFLQASREGPYLPPDDVIEQRKAEYYGDIIADVEDDTLSPAELYDALNQIQSDRIRIASSFPERIGGLEALHPPGLESILRLESDTFYARSRAHLYTWADLQENRMLRCVYTHVLISPEQLLLKDLLTQLGMEDALPRRFRNNQYLNCEHIVPQSWFHEESVPKADMHHLITADGQANNFRSDSAYRELGNEGDLGPNDRPDYLPEAGRKATAPKRFEPQRSREVVARATLYFLLTHKGRIDDSKYSDGDLETLKTWARSTLPSRYEQHRNEAIFEVQDNRNPLTDFPEWVDLIDFSRGLAT